MESIPLTTLILIEDLGMIYPNENSAKKRRYGVYQCECGNRFNALTASVKTGNTKSCGCYHKQRSSEANTTHGLAKHPIYNTWKSMIQRCTNPKDKSFIDYGARNITVCDRWLIFENFLEDMVGTWKEGLSIDRKKNDEGYSLANCRWATKSTQNRNTRIIRSTNTSGYRGVSWDKVSNKWKAYIGINNRLKNLGVFTTPLEAAIVYNTYVIENKLDHTINLL